jgi:hypothetical protein
MYRGEEDVIMEVIRGEETSIEGIVSMEPSNLFWSGLVFGDGSGRKSSSPGRWREKDRGEAGEKIWSMPARRGHELGNRATGEGTPKPCHG